LLASACREASETARKVSLLKGELAVVSQAQDMAEAKHPALIDRAADADQGVRVVLDHSQHPATELPT
jgi:hypothetical protein